MMKVKVLDVSRSEGPLYERAGEDDVLYVFDCGVVAEASDGRRYRHKTFSVPGAVKTEEGFWCPNRNYAEKVEAFAAKVRARGVVNLAYWEEVVEPPWAEREDWNLKMEADERAAWV